MQSIKEAQVRGKRVILRVDMNVPLSEDQAGGRVVRSDFRIQAALPTIRYLLEQGASIVLISHLGRPGGHFLPKLSLRPVAHYLAELLGRPVSWTDEVMSMDVRRTASKLQPGQLFMLGNVRFVPEEEAGSERFAEELATLGDLYVNDAFATCHRVHASVAVLPRFLPSYAGLRLIEEIETLRDLSLDPPRPYVVLLGGAKLADKIDTLQRMLPLADRVILGGGVANTFLAARGENVSLSLYEPKRLELAEELIGQFSDKIVLPFDWLVDYPSPNTFRILDVGALSLDRFFADLSAAKTIFWNGDFGLTEDERFLEGTKRLAEWLAGHKKTIKTIVSGGDTISLLDQFHLIPEMGFVSTGGGATLSFMAGQTLPGIAALDEALQYRQPAS